MFEHFGTFVSAVVFNQAVPFMSGIGGLVLSMVLYASKKANNYAPKLFFGLGVLAMFYACFAEWRSEYDKGIESTKEWKDRVNNIRIDDPAYQNLAALVATFERLKQTGKRRCAVFITNPRGAETSVFDTMVLAAGMAVCEQGFNSGLGSDPESVAIGLKGYIDDKVVIHAPRGDKDAMLLEDGFGPLFFVTQSREMLKNLPDG